MASKDKGRKEKKRPKQDKPKKEKVAKPKRRKPMKVKTADKFRAATALLASTPARRSARARKFR